MDDMDGMGCGTQSVEIWSIKRKTQRFDSCKQCKSYTLCFFAGSWQYLGDFLNPNETIITFFQLFGDSRDDSSPLLLQVTGVA